MQGSLVALLIAGLNLDFVSAHAVWEKLTFAAVILGIGCGFGGPDEAYISLQHLCFW